jgi:hypothetical protein
LFQTQHNQSKNMKKVLFPVLVSMAVASSAFAGGEMKAGKEIKGGVTPEPCFRDQELQIDIFGSYTDSVKRSDHGDGIGGGVAVNYFFMKYLGIGAEGNIYDGDVHGAWDLGGRLIARYPIEGSVCWAPYIFASGGVSTDGSTVGTWGAGGGIEVRVTHHVGLFGEGRYTWGEDRDAAQARVGVRFAF